MLEQSGRRVSELVWTDLNEWCNESSSNSEQRKAAIGKINASRLNEACFQLASFLPEDVGERARLELYFADFIVTFVKPRNLPSGKVTSKYISGLGKAVLHIRMLQKELCPDYFHAELKRLQKCETELLEVGNFLTFHKATQRSGGGTDGLHSAYIYRLHTYLSAHQPKQPVLVTDHEQLFESVDTGANLRLTPRRMIVNILAALGVFKSEAAIRELIRERQRILEEPPRDDI